MDDHRRSTEIVHWPISSLDGGAAVDRNKYRARLRSMSKTVDNPVDATRSAVEHTSDNRFHRVTPTSTRRHSIITGTGRFWNRAASVRAAKISVQYISSPALYEQLGQFWRVPKRPIIIARLLGEGRGGESLRTWNGGEISKGMDDFNVYLVVNIFDDGGGRVNDSGVWRIIFRVVEKFNWTNTKINVVNVNWLDSNLIN